MTELVKLFVAHWADVNVKDHDNRTPLHWAAWHELEEPAEILIAHGADLNTEDAYGDTPLSMTMQKPSITASTTRMANLLRRHGAKE